MVRPVAGDLPEQVKNNQSVNMAAGNGGQKMSQYPWFSVYVLGYAFFTAPLYLVNMVSKLLYPTPIKPK